MFVFLVISNSEFFMSSFWNSRLQIAGLRDKKTLENLKNSNFELHCHLSSIKKKLIYLRMIIWLIVLRVIIDDALQFSYIINLAHTTFFKMLNYTNRSFLECSIDLSEFIGLCWLYRTQYQFS